MSQSDFDKTTAMRLFHLKSLIRAKIDEWEKTAEAATYPQTKKWYTFFAQDLEKIYQKHLTDAPTFKS